jgi:hypothetical protein
MTSAGPKPAQGHIARGLAAHDSGRPERPHGPRHYAPPMAKIGLLATPIVHDARAVIVLQLVDGISSMQSSPQGPMSCEEPAEQGEMGGSSP